MVLTNIKRGNGTTNRNGVGLKNFIFIATAELYGRVGQRETLSGNVITEFKTTDIDFVFFEYQGVGIKFKTSSNGDEDAKHYNTEGEMFIPSITAEKSGELGSLVNHPCVVIVEDRNGNVRKLGELHDGVSCDIEEITEGKNGILLKFKISGQPTPPVFVESIAIIPKA